MLPNVSVIIPCLNEARYIRECLASLRAQVYPAGKLEILLIDGNSTDGTLEIVQSFTDVKIINNPRVSAASAMNLGIKQARAEVIIRADAHATYGHDYVAQTVRALKHSGATCVGGAQLPNGRKYFSRALAGVYAHSMGSGGAVYRDRAREGAVDTVYLGAWWKKDLHELGGFDENFLANEDYELNVRIRKSGGQVYLSPKIRSTYHPRGSFFALAAQYFNYGQWKVATLKKHPDSVRWRQWLPPLFVIGLLFLILLSFVSWSAFLAIVLGYIGFLLIKGPNLLGVLIIPVIHIAWGLGFLKASLVSGAPIESLQLLIDQTLRSKRSSTKMT